MLEVVCALVWASVCIPRPYDAVSELDAMWRPVDYHSPTRLNVNRLGLKITAYESDAIVPHDPNGLSERCEAGVCVRYRKHCDEARLVCTYWWGLYPPTRSPIPTQTVYFDPHSLSIRAGTP